MRTRRSRAEWAREVRKWLRSGLTARAYGEQSGRSYRQLKWWKWKLGLGGGGKPAETPSNRAEAGAAPASALQATGFVEARVVVAGPRGPVAASTVDIVVGSRRAVRVGGDFDEALVMRIVRLLEREP